MKNKKFLSVFLCLALMFLSSCITKSLWSNKHYLERINQFLIGADGRYIVLIADRYHYVFTDNSGILKTILSLKQRDTLIINIDKTTLKIDSNNDISGNMVFSGPFNLLPLEDIGTLSAIGIKPHGDEVTITLRIVGRRYLAKYIGDLPVLQTSYLIPIYYGDSNIAKGIGKAAITPVAVGLDAVLLIGKIIVSPLMME
jgi:hypothetical protein